MTRTLTELEARQGDRRGLTLRALIVSLALIALIGGVALAVLA